MANSPTPFPRRGSVFLVNLDPTFGKEIKKTRPAVVIQNDIGNKALIISLNLQKYLKF